MSTPYFLGRIPSKPDPRNYDLDVFLSTDPVDVALAALLADPHVARGTKNWASFEAPILKAASPTPPPPPPPPPPANGVVWVDNEAVLDQGQFGTCVGNGGAQWGNTLPIDDKFNEIDARAIYYECTIIDGAPDDPDKPGGGQQGSTVHSLAKALQNRGRLSVYAWAKTTDAIKQFLATGPFIVGIDWYENMFSPDANSFVYPTGSLAGGHCIILNAYYASQDAFGFLNSWGAGWGDNGRFRMKTQDFAVLLANNGEALAAVELP